MKGKFRRGEGGGERGKTFTKSTFTLRGLSTEKNLLFSLREMKIKKRAVRSTASPLLKRESGVNKLLSTRREDIAWEVPSGKGGSAHRKGRLSLRPHKRRESPKPQNQRGRERRDKCGKPSLALAKGGLLK